MDKTCWSGLVAGIVEGGVGGAGARAADGCWLRRVFLSSVMALACSRAGVLAPPMGVGPHQEGST